MSSPGYGRVRCSSTRTRAALVDTPAAVAAVRARHLRGYALDDVVVDPAGHESDLLNEGRILQTGHSAWWRDEVLARAPACGVSGSSPPSMPKRAPTAATRGGSAA